MSLLLWRPRRPQHRPGAARTSSSPQEPRVLGMGLFVVAPLQQRLYNSTAIVAITPLGDCSPENTHLYQPLSL
jgi:hypothetical protein